jgi:hypothetical protein
MDGDWLNAEASHLSRIEGMLDVDFARERERLDDRVQSLNESEPGSRASDPESRRYADEDEEVLDLDQYFSELLDR